MTAPQLNQTYAKARSDFLLAAKAADARLTSYPHHLKGPDGGDLAIDVAEFGPAESDSVLMVVSATHGVEGFAGSALQTHWLDQFAVGGEDGPRPDNVRVIVVHAFNPHGFAWVRRVNEDNVDLNRNFIDWDKPAPANTDYTKIADLVVPQTWTDEEQQRTLGELMIYLDKFGLAKLQAVVSGGQYDDENGVFFGGKGPTWSHRWLNTWANENLSAASQVAVLDLHTGLGERGAAQLIGAHAVDEEAHLRADKWFGNVVAMGGADSVSAYLDGDWLRHFNNLIEATVTAVAIEYGTIDPISVLQALRSDAWLHGYGDPAGDEAPAIKAAVRAAFAGDEPEWAEAIWGPFISCVTKAYAQLGA